MSFIGAYLEGQKAFESGNTISDNPYKQNKAVGEFDKLSEKMNSDWRIGGFKDAKESKKAKDKNNGKT